MDKYEYKVKLAQIEKLVKKKDYTTAAKIADGIDWRKVKSVKTLSMIADIYEETERLEDCYEILNMVYDRSPIVRSIVYRMAEVATKMHDFEEAIDLYKEFVRIAPHDLSKYILKYQIYRERGSSVADQIVILEEFKSHEYDEKWAYELACLYEEAGMIDRCIEECDELILWFSHGEYVTKALELKMKHQELTAAQQEKYDHRFEFFEEDDELEDLMEMTETEPEAEVRTDWESEREEAAADAPAEAEPETEPAEDQEEEASDQQEQAGEEEDTPVVPVVNTDKFSTLNLQAELAKGLELVMEQVLREMPAAAGEPEKVRDEEAETTTATAAEDEAVTEEEAAVADETVTEEEAAAADETVTEEDATAAEAGETEETETTAETEAKTAAASAEEAENGKKSAGEKMSETAELQTELLKYTSVEKEPDMDQLLREEEDGQIGLDIEEEGCLKKQITGQMTIEEILEAWEEKKRLAKEAIAKADDRKKPVLCETGEITNILDDFIPRTPKDICQPEECAELPEEAAELENIEDDLPIEIESETVAEAEQEAEEPKKQLKESAEDTKPQRTVKSDTESMLDAIEKALALEVEPLETSGRYMTEEEEKIFAYFTSVKGMKKQLLTLLEEDVLYSGKDNSAAGNLIITGHPGNGKTTLAIDMVKAFQKQRRVKGGKLAKVTGDNLNKKEPAAVLKKLGGGALIIEHAGALNAGAVRKLSEAMDGITGGALVILEDSASEIRQLLEKDEGFAAKFNRSIDIPIFSNDELVAFGKSYAEEQEYYFDEMAVLALYDSIGIRQTSNHVVNITEVKELVDNAIGHADKKSRGLFARFSKKRLDEYGNRLLLEEDFDE